jgi:hypothetical protein
MSLILHVPNLNKKTMPKKKKCSKSHSPPCPDISYPVNSYMFWYMMMIYYCDGLDVSRYLSLTKKNESK